MEKVYAGQGRIIPTKYGDLTKLSFSRSDLDKLINYMNDNDTEWVNIVLKEKKEKAEGKPTHYGEIDEWKPDNTEKKIGNPINRKEQKNTFVQKFGLEDSTDKLPF